MLGELADEQRGHDEHGAADRHPEAEVVEERKGDVARADLQRHDEVHQAGDSGIATKKIMITPWAVKIWS